MFNPCAGFGGRYDSQTGRPGDHTMEMDGGSTVPYLARTPRFPLFMLVLIGLEAKGLLDFQGRRGITSMVQCGTFARSCSVSIDVVNPGLKVSILLENSQSHLKLSLPTLVIPPASQGFPVLY